MFLGFLFFISPFPFCPFLGYDPLLTLPRPPGLHCWASVNQREIEPSCGSSVRWAFREPKVGLVGPSSGVQSLTKGHNRDEISKPIRVVCSCSCNDRPQKIELTCHKHPCQGPDLAQDLNIG